MALNYNTNLGFVSSLYLDKLKANVLRSTFVNKLVENPFYPSLYSLTDTFRKYNIDTEAYEIPAENLTKVPTPFITFLRNQEEGIDFALVNSINSNTISYITKDEKEISISLDRFLHFYKGYVFIADKNEKSGDPNYALALKLEKERYVKRNLWLAGLLAVLSATILYNFSIEPFSWYGIASFTSIAILKVVGLLICCLLLTFEIDKENTLVKNICSSSKKTNCSAVVDSKAAKIFGIGWSEIGFYYFASSLLFLLNPSLLSNTKFFLIALANAVAVPYVAFSVYYQWKIVKQWCPLCLGVQAVLLTEFIWSVTSVWLNVSLPVFEWSIVFSALIAMLIPVLLWNVSKRLLKDAQDSKLYKAAYKRLQYNPEVFNKVLVQQVQAPEGLEQIGIDLGNPNASNTVVKVCGPYCGPCAKAHPELEELIKNNSNVKVKIVFSVTNDANDRSGIVARHLLAIAQKGDRQLTEKALDDWYLADKKDYEVFASKYPLNGEVAKQAKHVDEMVKWCTKAEIAYTPTFYVNGHRIPEGYRLEELKEIL